MSISVRGLTKTFGETIAVDSLDLDIDKGEFLVLLGPSGCGKTTTMRCIAGLEVPTAGRIEISGHVVFDKDANIRVPANKRNVGMVFQSYAIWPHMTVSENVGYPLRMQKLPKKAVRQRVAEVLDLVGLSGLGDRNASKLSGGQMQRVAVARSVAMEPRVLLFDEPLSNLDAKLRDKLRFELRELQQRLNITAVYVTHDQGEALALADRIAVMREGRFVQTGSPERVYNYPNSLFVADFIGAGNLLEGEVVERAGESCSVRVAGTDLVVASQRPAPESSKAHLCMRRESLQLCRKPVSGPNVWPARVRIAVFMGNHVSYHVDLRDGPSIFVETFDSDPLIPAGTDVWVHIPPDAVLPLEDD